jgi:undecaprenyl diphosphate synthase
MLRRQLRGRNDPTVRPPDPHESGARPPQIPLEFVPKHVALVMDGNGRWANMRGLSRVEGHKRGEAVVLDVAKGAIELGVKWISLYAFSGGPGGGPSCGPVWSTSCRRPRSARATTTCST